MSEVNDTKKDETLPKPVFEAVSDNGESYLSLTSHDLKLYLVVGNTYEVAQQPTKIANAIALDHKTASALAEKLETYALANAALGALINATGQVEAEYCGFDNFEDADEETQDHIADHVERVLDALANGAG